MATRRYLISTQKYQISTLLFCCYIQHKQRKIFYFTGDNKGQTNEISFPDVNSLCIISQRRCFPVERFTFLLTFVSCVAFSKACFTNYNNNLIVSRDFQKLKRTGTVVLHQIKNKFAYATWVLHVMYLITKWKGLYGVGSVRFDLQ